MWKKLISLNLALLLLIALLPVSGARAARGGDTGYATFHKNDSTEGGSDETKSIAVDNFIASGAYMKLYTAAPYIGGENKVVTSYNTREDGSGKPHHLTSQLGESFSSDESAPAHLYAQWTDAPGKYIFYISTGGTFSDGKDYQLKSGLSGQETLLGDDTKLSSLEEGSRVIGWSTNDNYNTWRSFSDIGDAASTFFKPSESVDMGDSLILYPIIGCNYITFHYAIAIMRNGKIERTVETSPTRFYPKEESLGLDRSLVDNNRIFIGWNTNKEGTGEWYSAGSLASSVKVHDLYVQYADIPQGYYYILNISSEDGKPKTVAKPADGKADLPSEDLDHNKIAYWTSGISDYCYYPTGEHQGITTGLELTPVYAQAEKDYYSAVIDGGEGTTKAGSKYSAAQIVPDSETNIKTFAEMDCFTKRDGVVIGYKGSKTQTVYPLDAPALETIQAEADDDHIARFTAIYESVQGKHIQYVGNGAALADGKAYAVQDNLTPEEPESGRYNGSYIKNPFTAPAGKVFLGWNAYASPLSYAWYEPGDPITVSGDSVLYAIWGRSRVVYHYNENSKIDGGQKYPDRIVTDLGDGSRRAVEESRYDPNTAGGSDTYVFAGWCTSSSGDGDWYFPGQLVPDGVLHLYERLVKVPEDCGFYYVLSTLREGNQVVKMTAEREEITLPAASGIGWRVMGGSQSFTSFGFKDANPDLYTAGDKITVTSGETVAAVDTVNLINYHKNLEGQDQTRVYYNCSVYATVNIQDVTAVFSDIPDGREFQGWNTRSDGSGASCSANAQLPVGTDLDLYAIWKDTTPPASGDDPEAVIPDVPAPGGSEDSTPTATTTTTTTPDGGTVTTTNNADGATSERTVTSAGVTAQVERSATGQVTSAQVTIPSAAEGVVTAPMEVEAAATSAAAPEISVKVNGGGAAKVEIPVTKPEPGTAAVVVHADGTEEVVRDCVTGKNGVMMDVNGEVTVKIVNRTVEFTDVRSAGHWASDSVEFAAARDLFKGTGDNEFTPDGSMTRGMMVTVLYRLAYEPENTGALFNDVAAGTFYTGAVSWAASNQVVLGYSPDTFGPEDNVTREQMVTILYRYAALRGGDVPASRASLERFGDAGTVHDFAKDAMSWAVGVGIITGSDSGDLSPEGDSTRAEVATVLQRFCENVLFG